MTSTWLLDEINAILARRYDLCKPLIIITNSSVEVLAKHLPERYGLKQAQLAKYAGVNQDTVRCCEDTRKANAKMNSFWIQSKA